jgi:hypothetical protein
MRPGPPPRAAAEHAPIRSAITAACLLVLAVLAWPPAAGAAPPLPRAEYSAHQHGTGGRDWHVELTVGRSVARLESVVLYLQECGLNGFAQDVPVDASGSFEVTAALKAGGSWTVRGSFRSTRTVVGTYEVAAGSCPAGPRSYRGLRAGAEPHRGHAHFMWGTPPGHYAHVDDAAPSARAAAGRLHRATMAAAATPRFRTYAAARRQYTVTARNRPRPLVFHLRHEPYFDDGRQLDPRRPESLVWWWPAAGPPILVAFMYRAETLRPPRTGGGIFGWHAHGRRTAPMTHVWLTRDLRSAAANCLPVQELERDVPGFRFAPPAHGAGPESTPCPTGHADGAGHVGHDHHHHPGAPQ